MQRTDVIEDEIIILRILTRFDTWLPWKEHKLYTTLMASGGHNSKLHYVTFRTSEQLGQVAIRLPAAYSDDDRTNRSPHGHG